MPNFSFLIGVIFTCPGGWVGCGGYVVGCGDYVVGCGGYVLCKMKIMLTPSSSTEAGIGLSLAKEMKVDVFKDIFSTISK